MAWGEKPEDFTGEPKNVFCNFLIWNLKNISFMLYYEHRYAHSLGPLMEIIDSLDEKAKQALDSQRKELQLYNSGEKSINGLEDLYKIYSVIASYLHRTYLRQVGYAVPKYVSKKLEMPQT